MGEKALRCHLYDSIAFLCTGSFFPLHACLCLFPRLWSPKLTSTHPALLWD